jgi:membrane-associated phospholipid phosphatase
MLEDLLIASPLIIIVTFAVIALCFRSIEYLVVAGVLFVFGLVFNLYLKYFFYAVSDVWPHKNKRPSDCPNENTEGCESCSIIRKRRKSKLSSLEALGLPSGHAQFMAIATVLTYYVLNKFGFETQIIGLVVMCLWTAAVCYQRVTSECHSIYQVVLGCIIGALVGGGVSMVISEFQIFRK